MVQNIFSTYWMVDFEQFCWLFSWTHCSSHCCSCCCEDCPGLDCCSPSGCCCCCCYCYCCCCGPQPPCCWWREPSCTSYRCWEGQRCWEKMVLLVVGRSANAAASWNKKTKALFKKDSKFNFFCILQSIEFGKSCDYQLLSEHFLMRKEKNWVVRDHFSYAMHCLKIG